MTSLRTPTLWNFRLSTVFYAFIIFKPSPKWFLFLSDDEKTPMSTRDSGEGGDVITGDGSGTSLSGFLTA